MNTEELERLLEGGTETQRIEFKGPCSWDVEIFAKDILALSNVKGGGYIIFGIIEKNGKFHRKGMSEKNIRTYNPDIMKDQMGNFADPGVDFEVKLSNDINGNKYIIIVVKEFRDIPIICKKDSRDTRKGVLYYRNTDRRPESAPVSNSHDMMDIIELAVIKMMKRKKELGYVVETSDDELFDIELRSLWHDIIGKIQSRGYWKILFRPLSYKEEKILNLSDCKNIIEKHSVEFRSWDYPHFPRREDIDTGLCPGNNYYEGWVDWNVHKELWRMYQSGQFIHYRGLFEDWHDEDSFMENAVKYKPKFYLGILHTICQITEIFEFLSGLAKEGIYKERMNLSISLMDTKDRKLKIDELDRIPFSRDYKTIAQEIEFKKQYTEIEIIENSTELAIKAILYFFERFDWTPSEDIVRSDQKKILERRI